MSVLPFIFILVEVLQLNQPGVVKGVVLTIKIQVNKCIIKIQNKYSYSSTFSSAIICSKVKVGNEFTLIAWDYPSGGILACDGRPLHVKDCRVDNESFLNM